MNHPFNLNIIFRNQGSSMYKTSYIIFHIHGSSRYKDIIYHISHSRDTEAQNQHIYIKFALKDNRDKKPSYIIFHIRGSSRHKTIIYHILDSRVIEAQSHDILHLMCQDLQPSIKLFECKVIQSQISFLAFKGQRGTILSLQFLNLESYKLNIIYFPIKSHQATKPSYFTIMGIGVQSHHISYFSSKRHRATQPS
jgi:hypothetical protein